MKIAEFYCDLCGKKVEADPYDNEASVLNNIRSSMSTTKELDLYVCDSCVDRLKQTAEKTQERILRGEREEVKSVNDVDKEETLKALKVLHDNYVNKDSICYGILCTEDNCPFSKYDSCKLSDS